MPEAVSFAIQEKIENYIDYLDDLDYIDAVLETADFDTLFSVITQMLQSGIKDRVLSTHLFIRDAMRLYSKHPDNRGNPSTSEICLLFRQKLPDSTVVGALHKNVFSNIYTVRSSTVYTLGRIVLKTSIPVLKESFRSSLDNDLLLLPQLLSALEWLGRSHIWKLIEKMARSPHAMTRWAALGCGFLDYFDTPKSKRAVLYTQRQMYILYMLKNDQYPLVRREAEYKWRQCQLALNRENPDEQPEKAPLLFESAQIRFQNLMSDMHQDDYSVSDLEAFVLQL